MPSPQNQSLLATSAGNSTGQVSSKSAPSPALATHCSIDSATRKLTPCCTVSSFLAAEFTASDAVLAARLQAAEDARLAQQLEDERLAAAYDPWKRAEAEWASVEQKQNEESDRKLALSLTGDLKQQDQRRQQKQLAQDSAFAKRLDANPTPQKSKKVP